ncbi:Putrescine importer PuuP, partial [Weizmannia sp. CD-2023]|nr:Putrescine importer PuuP [Weizmannia sp. CD-2023]
VQPKRWFGSVEPKFRTPAWNVILVGLVSLLAITPSLELISSFINFGALIAFTFVNLSVIAFFVFRKKRYKTAKDVFSYLVMPLAGAGLTGVLWSNLQKDALIFGIIWSGIGFIYMAIQTKFFRKQVIDFQLDEAEKTSIL